VKVNVLPKLLLLILLSLAMACGATAYHRGRYLMDHGLYDDAVAQLTAAQKGNPRNVKYKTELVRAKLAAAQKHIENAKLAMGHDKLEDAALELQKALTYDPGNQYAKDMLDKVIEWPPNGTRRPASLSFPSMR
jgi:tetratricopeptide (TPR) repeat protein